KLNAPYLLPVNFTNPTSGHHANVTAVRFGEIRGLLAAQYTVDENVSYIVAPASTASVVLTVGSALDTVAAHSLVVKNASDAVVAATSVSGNVHTYTLPAGDYTYVVSATDTRYIGSASGAFFVELENVIQQPTYGGTTKAGEQITIPDAVIYYKGAATQNVAAYTATYTDRADNASTVVSGSTFTPDYTGTLTVTYTYAGALSKTLVINVTTPKDTAANRAIASGKDGIYDLAPVSADGRVAWSEADGGYIVWSIDGNKTVAWSNLRFTPAQTAAIGEKKDDFGFLHIRALAVSTATSGWRAFFCSDKFVIGEDGTSGILERLAFNVWHDIYIPVEKLDIANYFASISFNSATAPQFTAVSAVYLGGFDFVSLATATLTLNDSSAGSSAFEVDENVTFTLGNAGALAYTLSIFDEADALAATLQPTGGTFTWTKADKVQGNYRAVLNAPAGYYYAVAPAVTFVVRGDVLIEAEDFATPNGGYKAHGVIVLPTAALFWGEIADTENVPVRTASYTYADSVVVPVTGDTFTPDASGTLTVQFTYEGAVSVTKTADVAVNAPQGFVLDVSHDFATYFAAPPAGTTLSYIAATETERAYISYAATTAQDWKNLNFKSLALSTAVIVGYDAVRLWLYAVSETVPTWRPLLLDGTYCIAGQAKNTWFYYDIPATVFAANTGYFTSVQFNLDRANYPFVSEVRFAGFECVNYAGALSVNSTHTTAGGTVALTATVPQGAAYSVEIFNAAGAKVKALPAGATSIAASELGLGRYTAKLLFADGTGYTSRAQTQFVVYAGSAITIGAYNALIRVGDTLDLAALAKVYTDGTLDTLKTINRTASFAYLAYYNDTTPAAQPVATDTFTPTRAGNLTVT
ncbi:MAG: hypothetical protein LBM78_03625, partial [Clostridiales bacterium]|nr:hypothetical protein [Clostridiales bacterium]